MQVTRYFASYGIDIDKSSIKKVDSVLNRLEKRFKKLGDFTNSKLSFGIGNFKVDQKKLNATLGNALDIASNSTVFEITKFHVNQTALNRQIGNALDRASGMSSLGVRGTTGRHTTLSPGEWDRRQSVLGAASLTRHQRALELASIRGEGRSLTTPKAVGGGMIGGGLARFYGPALTLGLGGYGLGALNQRNQEVVAAQLQSQAVVQQAGGTTEQGTQSFEYLKREANRIGFNYLESSGDYNKLISGLTGAGVGLSESQRVFSGFAELARVNKLDKTTQNRLFRALSQVAGKGKLQAEELTGQISEALPGGTALFARAYQAQLAAEGRGGGLVGQAAISKLQADMKKGLVTSNILTYAGQAASNDAQATLPQAQKASQAEQQRYQNALTDLSVIASDSGVEEGFARIFRTLTMGLQESSGLVQTLAEGFNEATKFADDLMLFPQSFVRALEGRDSLVADWLGIGKTSQLVKDWQDIRTIWGQINSLDPSKLFGDFLPSLESTARELAAILDSLAGLGRIFNGQFPTQLSNRSETEKAGIFGFEYTSPAAIASDFFNNTLYNIGQARERDRAVNDPSSPYYGDLEGYNEQKKGLEMSAATDTSATFVPSTTTNQFEISINIDPVTLANMDIQSQAQGLGEWFRTELENASVNFPQKE